MSIVLILAYCIYAYLGIGMLVGIYLILRGLPARSAKFRDSGWAFRLIIFPGLVALWPLVFYMKPNAT